MPFEIIPLRNQIVDYPHRQKQLGVRDTFRTSPNVVCAAIEAGQSDV